MKTPETRSDEVRRVGEPRRVVQDQQADTVRRQRELTHLVDPYDMQPDPQPEEPGYGHGV